MGILALVDYSLIKELCSKVQRDNRRFSGKLKIDPEENERPATENSKVDAFKRILLSDRPKSGKRKKPQKKPPKQKSGESKKRFKQSDRAASDSGSSSDSSIANSSSANDSEITDNDEESRNKPETESK